MADQAVSAAAVGSPGAEPLSARTTLHLGGPGSDTVHATTQEQLILAVRDLDEAGVPLLLVAGGSNLVVADEGFAGTVVSIETRGLDVATDLCSGATVTVAAGESWDELVAHAVGQGWVGVEALAGIPGSVGATPVQNVGAYGQEVSDTVASVRCWDRSAGRVRTFAAADCAFGYRTSRFKLDPERFVVLTVTFQLPLGELSAPVRYAELAGRLGVEIGGRRPLAQVRQAVLALRRAKGMVLDEADHDTWSAGSFFTNPLLDRAAAAALPAQTPRWELSDGTVKASAAWLIEHAGYPKGYGNDRVSLSTKHTLALTNRGAGSTADLLALAREIRDGVAQRFGVHLAHEPALVGCAL